MIDETYISLVKHLGSTWLIVKIRNSFYARINTSDTGPFSTPLEAENFICAIVKAS